MRHWRRPIAKHCLTRLKCLEKLAEVVLVKSKSEVDGDSLVPIKERILFDLSAKEDGNTIARANVNFLIHRKLELPVDTPK